MLYKRRRDEKVDKRQVTFHQLENPVFQEEQNIMNPSINSPPVKVKCFGRKGKRTKQSISWPLMDQQLLPLPPRSTQSTQKRNDRRAKDDKGHYLNVQTVGDGYAEENLQPTLK